MNGRAAVGANGVHAGGCSAWQRFEIRRLEDLGNAVLGAALDVVQMPGPPVRGSLAFAACRGVLFSSGLLEGNTAIYGPLSPDAITIGIGLRFGANSRLWLSRVRDGEVAVVRPGDAHDATLTAGTLYATATLSAQLLKAEARRQGLDLLLPGMLRTGLYPPPIEGSALAALTRLLSRLHQRGPSRREGSADIGPAILRAAMEHCRRARMVFRARRHIATHLATRLTRDTLASTSGTSWRTLSRAFLEVLDEPPGAYIRRLRLHRIRRDLTSPEMAGSAVAAIAARWGMAEPGRMAGWYRDLFGESPSTTREIASERSRLAEKTL
jgi:AraC-like DNA-binding protein